MLIVAGKSCKTSTSWRNSNCPWS